MSDTLKLVKHTPAPWGWFGNTDTDEVYLATKHSGRIFVLRIERKQFLVQPFPRNKNHAMRDHTHFVEYEVCPTAKTRKDPGVYRADFHKLRHPDLALIAASAAMYELLQKLHAKLDAECDTSCGEAAEPYLEAMRDDIAKLFANIQAEV